MSELKSMPEENLKRLIAETEETLADLKDEIERREQAAQSREIAHLDDHMRSAEFSLKTIRDFFHYLRGEFRDHP